MTALEKAEQKKNPQTRREKKSEAVEPAARTAIKNREKTMREREKLENRKMDRASPSTTPVKEREKKKHRISSKHTSRQKSLQEKPHPLNLMVAA